MTIYGDGATIHTLPLINVFASGIHNQGVCWMWLTVKNMSTMGERGAKYKADKMLDLMNNIEPYMTIFVLITFDRRGSVQNTMMIMNQY